MIITRTIGEHEYVVAFTVEARHVEISQDKILAGAGRWDGESIRDCAARLGAEDGSETESVYEALDEAVAGAIEESQDGEDPYSPPCRWCGHPVPAEGVSISADEDIDVTGSDRPRCSDTSCDCQ